MSLDLGKVLDIASEHATIFAKSFGEILAHPIRRFRYPLHAPVGQMQSRFWAFVILSIFIGSTVDAATSRFQLPDFVITLVITVLCWTAFCVVIHGACRLLGGRGAFEQSFVISFQVLAVVYVISHFSAFVVSRIPLWEEEVMILCGIMTYLVVQAILLVVYWPLALRAAHRLSIWSWVVLPLLILSGFTGLNYLLFEHGLVVGWDIKNLRPT